MSTLYFEAENEDELREVGYCNERRVDPQMGVRLLLDRAGFLSRSAARPGSLSLLQGSRPRPP